MAAPTNGKRDQVVAILKTPLRESLPLQTAFRSPVRLMRATNSPLPLRSTDPRLYPQDHSLVIVVSQRISGVRGTTLDWG